VTVTVDGVTHSGTYFVQESMVEVRSPLGRKNTPVGGSPPEAVAKLLLSELVRARRAIAPADAEPESRQVND
jgi:hypothetical protein